MWVDNIFESVKHLFKPDKVITDNQVFRLHYRMTTAFLMISSLLVVATEVFGDPIDCIINADEDDDDLKEFINTYCWTRTTFSLSSTWTSKDEAAPGVGNSNGNQKDRVNHSYYQWVAAVLLLQAFLFYVPRYLWYTQQNNRIEMLVMSLDNPVLMKLELNQQVRALVQYFVVNLNFSNNRGSLLTYAMLECANLINVITQMALINKFLNGMFWTLGWKVIQFHHWQDSVAFDPLSQSFPLTTKCLFHDYGSSGDIQRLDAYCVLTVNILNRKIYLILWFWFVFLAIVSLLAVVYRVLVNYSSKIRILVSQRRCQVTDKQLVEQIVLKLGLADWFLFDMLGKNCDPQNFKLFVESLFISLNR